MTAARTPLSWTGAVVVLFLATLIGTRPLAWSLGSGTLDPLDGILGTWILAWGAKALGTDPGAFFHAPVFYPAANSLAFSENLLGILPFFGPLFAMSGDAFWATNAFVLLSVFFTGLATFVLTLHWTGSRVAGVVAGLFFIVSPIRLAQTAPLHLWAFWWTPLALWTTSRFLQRGRWKDVAFAAAFGVVQFAASRALGVVLVILLGAYVGIHLLRDRTLWRRDLLIKGGVAAGASGLLLLPLLLPTMRVSEAWGVAGFASFGILAQLGLLLALALALLAGFGAAAVLKRWEGIPGRRIVLGLLVVTLALAGIWTRPLTLYPQPQASALDHFLARRAEGPIVTVPMLTYQEKADAQLEASRMIAGLTHGLPMVNGTSGVVPRSYLDLARRLERGPEPEALDALAAVGVKTLVVRLDQMPQGLRERWELDRDPSALGLVPLWFDEGKSAVYHLTRTPKPADLLYASLLVPERLPAGWDFTMGVALNVPGKNVWTAPMPPQRQPLTVRWDGPAQQHQVSKPVWLPMTVQGPETVGIPLRAPARPGRYLLTLEGASLKATASVEVQSWKAADSLTGPIDARVTWKKPQPSDAMVPGSVMPLRWEVVNTGENVWRARTTWRQRLAAHPEWLREHPHRLVDPGAGEVMLEVRWLKRRTGTEISEGPSRVRRYPIRHDVFPGQRYVFDETLFVPSHPGGYRVELRLTDAFGTFSTPIERREVRVHALADLRDFLKRFEGM